MSISTKLKKIEGYISRKFSKKMVILQEMDGKRFIYKDGKLEDFTIPEDDSETLYIVEKTYLPYPQES